MIAIFLPLLLSAPMQAGLSPNPTQLATPSTSGLPAAPAERGRILGQRLLKQQNWAGELSLIQDLGWSSSAHRLLYQRQVLGIPVRGEVIKVNLFRDGSAMVEGPAKDLFSGGLSSLPITAEVSAGAAEQTALSTEVLPGAKLTPIHTRLVWAPHAENGRPSAQPRLVWEVRAQVEANGKWTIDLLVDAVNGSLVDSHDLRLFHRRAVTGTGRVFIPNPVQSSGNMNLTDQNDSNAAVPSSEYFQVSLLDLAGTGYLDGPYATTSPTRNRVYEPTNNFVYSRSANAFEEVMCYYTVDSFQRYLQTIGQPNANNHPQKMDVNGTHADNSWFDTGSKIITYGDGGVDDAEDSDIILHEYGHALHDDVQGGIGGGQNSSISEGYGDYFAASFYDDALVGEWDATSYTNGSLHYLRRVDLDLHYPNNLNHEVHHDGQIWSAMLWDMRMALGREIADNIIVEAMSLQSLNSNMPSAGGWLLTAGQQLYNGEWNPYIEWALDRRGIKTLPTGTVLLSPADSSPVAGHSTSLKLTATNYPGESFKTLASMQAGSNVLGPPWNVTLQVGFDLLSVSLAQPGFVGTLNSAGQANIPLNLPPSLLATPVVFQAAIFNSQGGLLAISKPCAVRSGPY